MHAASQMFDNRFLPEAEFADEGLGRLRGPIVQTEVLEQLQRGRVSAEGDHGEIIFAVLSLAGFNPDAASLTSDLFHPAGDGAGAFFFGHHHEISVEALALGNFQPLGTDAAKDRPDPLLVKRSFDPDAADIQMEHVGIDPAPDDGIGKVDPLDGQELDEGFGDDPAAHVAARGSRPVEVTAFVMVDRYPEA